MRRTNTGNNISVGCYNVGSQPCHLKLTNWLTDNASDALLYGCLVEAAAFNRNYALQERYMAMYQKAVQDITQEQQVRNSIDNMYQRNAG